jgi:hypothetical protein
LLQALADRSDPISRAAVEKQLAAGDKSVRLAAIRALGQTGDASAVEVLAGVVSPALAADESKAVENALASLRGGEAVDRALVAQVMNRKAGPKAPFLAALVRRASPAAKEIFLGETGSADPAMARLAFRGLSRVAGEQDVPKVLNAMMVKLKPGVEEDAVAAVGQILERLPDKARRSAPVLAALKTTSDAAASSRLLRLLPFCGDAPALAAVAAAVKEGSTHEAAVSALADWPDPAAWAPLLEVCRETPDASERVLALRGLTRLLAEQNAKPDANLVGRYRELFAVAGNDADRKLVLGPLVGCAHPEALKLAVDQLAYAGVRAEAELAVRKIAESIRAAHPEAARQALERLK